MLVGEICDLRKYYKNSFVKCDPAAQSQKLNFLHVVSFIKAYDYYYNKDLLFSKDYLCCPWLICMNGPFLLMGMSYSVLQVPSVIRPS